MGFRFGMWRLIRGRQGKVGFVFGQGMGCTWGRLWIEVMLLRFFGRPAVLVVGRYLTSIVKAGAIMFLSSASVCWTQYHHF